MILFAKLIIILESDSIGDKEIIVNEIHSTGWRLAMNTPKRIRALPNQAMTVIGSFKTKAEAPTVVTGFR